MKDEEMDALMARGREALEGVTAGPWSLFSGNNGRILSVCIGDKPNGRRPCIVDTGGFEGTELPKRANAANGSFIATARDLVPDLLDALIALRAERDEWRNDYKALSRAIVGDTGLSAMTVAAQARLFRPRAEAAEARALADARRERDEYVATIEDALKWYGEQSRLCRLIHKEGDTGRYSLQEDGGKRANDALSSRVEGGAE